MEDERVRNLPWLPELRDEIQQALNSQAASAPDIRPALEHERQQLEEAALRMVDILGQSQAAPAVRLEIEADYNKALERRNDIDVQLAGQDSDDARRQTIVDPRQVIERVDHLADVLAKNNPTLGNLELSMHIDRIVCHPDGKVLMRTCKLGTLPDAIDVLATAPEVTDGQTRSAAVNGKAKARPRRRTRLRTDNTDDDKVDMRALADFAADPNRFSGLGDEWFWIDIFQVPGPRVPWYVEHAEAVFKRRQEKKLSYDELAREFGTSKPTAMAAVRHFLETHPEAVDAVELSAGGSRRKRMDVAPIADEVRKLWWDDNWSKQQLGVKYSCATTTIDRALAKAYAKTGEKVPTEEEHRQHKIDQARKLHDDRTQLADIARVLRMSDVCVRRLLRESFAAQGQPMPDLRRRKSKSSDQSGNCEEPQ